MQAIFWGINNLHVVLENAKKVLLVCDSSYPNLNIKDDIERINFPHVVFDQFSSNPIYDDVCKGVDLFQITKCDTILAVGGGSTIDVAKCIKLYCKMSRDRLYIDQQYEETGIQLIAVPTTAGTGSESTRYAVIYYHGEKKSVTHESIIPNVVILDSKVLKTLPLYQKKCTMLDALCQGIESWWSINSTEESRILSRKAVGTIMKWWQEYIYDNTEESARQIMNAANIAGQAISITQTTAPHAFSYKLTSMYGLPHGHAVAICLPIIWKYMVDHKELCIDSRGYDYVYNIFCEIAETIGDNNVETAINILFSQLESLAIRIPLLLDVDDLKTLCLSVNSTRLRNNPFALDDCSIQEIYRGLLTMKDLSNK